MKKELNRKAKYVEDIEHFPFENFDELKKRVSEGVAHLGVDRSAALQWIQNGIYSTRWQRTQALFLAFLPFITGIGFIVYAIITRSWLLLLALPVLLICFFIFHPSSAMIFGPIRSGLIGLSIVGLIWGAISGVEWLVAVTLTLVIIWCAQRATYRKATDGVLRAVMEHEDLLCILWRGNALNVSMYNGDSYWSQWKTEGGKSTHYDTGNTYKG